ncbi:MAG: hypothetical protein AB7P17_09375 [Nitrospirales bacterium]|nr:hypothetical protein [Nitrospirales bacterium]
MGERAEQSHLSQGTMGTFEETVQSQLRQSWSATPAQRLAWLEEALELAYRAGAISPTVGKRLTQ